MMRQESNWGGKQHPICKRLPKREFTRGYVVIGRADTCGRPAFEKIRDYRAGGVKFRRDFFLFLRAIGLINNFPPPKKASAAAPKQLKSVNKNQIS